MATIASTLKLNDQMSTTFKSITTAMSSTLTAMRSIKDVEIGAEYAEAARDIQLAKQALAGLDDEMASFAQNAKNATQGASDGFTVMKGIAIQAIMAIARAGVDMLGNFIEFGDEMVNISGRLVSITRGAEAAAVASEKIYFASQRARVGYDDMVGSVTKLAQQAGSAFDNNIDATIAFQEALGNVMTIDKTDASGVQSVMYNLTQAIARGVLRGQDLNAVLQNTPTLARLIEQSMGWAEGSIREYAAAGEISASVVSNALLSNYDEIGRIAAEMPETFSQTAIKIEGSMEYAFSRMGISFNQFLSEQIQGGMKWLIENFDTLATVAATVGTVLLSVAAGFAIVWAIQNWHIIAIIAGIVLLGAILSEFGISADQILAGLGGTFGWLYGIIYNGIAIVWNVIATFAEFFANVFNDPIGSVQRLFIGVFDAILGIVETVAGAIGALLGQDWGGAIGGFRAQLQAFAASTYGAGAVQIERMELKGVSDTMKAGADLLGGAGKSLLDGVDKLKDTMSSGFGAGAGGMAIDFPADLTSGGSGGKALNTRNVEPLITEEDIKLLTDIATRDYQFNYRQITPNVTMTFGDIRETADADSIIERFASAMEEMAMSRLDVAHG